MPASELRDFSRSLPMALMRTREAAMRQFRPLLRSFDLTEQQWRVLRALHHAGEMDVTRLSAVTMLLAPSLTRILRDLDRRGLVTRRPALQDARVSLISLAGPGQTILRDAGAQSETIYRRMSDALGDGRLDALIRELADIETQLNAITLATSADRDAASSNQDDL